jgi:hypothetical protein
MSPTVDTAGEIMAGELPLSEMRMLIYHLGCLSEGAYSLPGLLLDSEPCFELILWYRDSRDNQVKLRWVQNLAVVAHDSEVTYPD